MAADFDYKEAAFKMAERFRVRLLDLKGKRLRVVRAVVYEGDALEVMEQLAKSLPVGPKVIAGKLDLTITVVDEGLLQILEDS